MMREGRGSVRSTYRNSVNFTHSLARLVSSKKHRDPRYRATYKTLVRMNQQLVLAILLLGLQLCFADPEDECPQIITRQEWGGAPASNVNYLIVPIPYVVIQHTASPECSDRTRCSARVESIRSYHMDVLGWHDIGYSFLIGGDGSVYEGCGWTKEGAHTYGYNKKSVGIGFVGNFQEKDASKKMVDAAHKLIRCGKARGILREDVRVIGARQVSSTASPGLRLYNQIQRWPEWVASP